jgi:membrane fusion protein, heavy metal efflux system
MNHRLFVLAFSAMLVACGSSKSTASKTAPSEVMNPVAEAQLTVVKLTSEAVARLGVVTAAVERRHIASTTRFGGEVIAAPGHQMSVTAPVAGMIRAPAQGAFPVAGARLAAGATVLRIVPLPASADLLASQETLTLRRAQVERTTALLAAGGASREELEQAQLDLARAEATIGVAQGRSASAGAGQSANALALTTPASAELQALHVAPGQLVAAGAPLFDLIDIGTRWVRVPVYPGALASVDGKAPASIAPLTNWSGGAERPARRVAGPNTANAAAGSADLYYALEGTNATVFRVGERVRATLESGQSADALIVPESAIWRDIHGGAWVYVQLKPNEYARERVELQRISGGQAVLLRGPAVGTPVVTVAVAELAGTEFGVDH